MNLMLNDLLDKCVLVYIDDILIYSRSKQDHVEHVKVGILAVKWLELAC